MAALLHGRARRRDAVLTKELTHAVEVRVEADAEEDGRLPRMRRVGHLWADQFENDVVQLEKHHLHARLQIRRSSLGRETERML